MIFITKEEDLNFDQICALYFYASWVPFHKKMLVMLNKMEERYPIKYFAIDIDNFSSIVKRFSIECVPTVLIFNKKELKRIKGLVLTSAFRKAFSDVIDNQE